MKGGLGHKGGDCVMKGEPCHEGGTSSWGTLS